MYVKIEIKNQTATDYELELVDFYIKNCYLNNPTSPFSKENTWDKMEKDYILSKKIFGSGFVKHNFPLVVGESYWCIFSVGLNAKTGLDFLTDSVYILSSTINDFVYIDESLKFLDMRASSSNPSLNDYPRTGYYIGNCFLARDKKELYSKIEDKESYEYKKLLEFYLGGKEGYHSLGESIRYNKLKTDDSGSKTATLFPAFCAFSTKKDTDVVSLYSKMRGDAKNTNEECFTLQV